MSQKMKILAFSAAVILLLALLLGLQALRGERARGFRDRGPRVPASVRLQDLARWRAVEEGNSHR